MSLRAPCDEVGWVLELRGNSLVALSLPTASRERRARRRDSDILYLAVNVCHEASGGWTHLHLHDSKTRWRMTSLSLRMGLGTGGENGSGRME